MSKKLEQLRSKITSLQSEIRELRSMPLCPAECETRVDQVVETLSRQFDGDWLGRQIAGPGHIDMNSDPLFSTAAAGSPDKVAAMIAWLMPDVLRDHLLDAARPHAIGELSEAGRQQGLAELASQLHETEVAEERLITELEASGQEVYRRPDVDPAVVLGVA